MHYYKKNLGDYAKKAGRLSILQHGVYNLLMDACYDRETFPTMEEAIDWIWASSKEEIEALEFVLRKFFKLQEDGTYTQKRIELTIQEYQGQSITNKINGAKGGRPKGKNKAKETQPVNKKTHSVNLESEINPTESLNQEPLTINHKPLKEVKEKWSLPEWVNADAWSEFESHRKQINKPLTDLARTKAAKCLDGFSHDEQQRAIDDSIQSRWSGIFPKKSTGAKNETGSSNTRPKSKAEGFWDHTKARIKATA